MNPGNNKAPRVGFVGIIVENTDNAPRVNAVLSEMSKIIVGRMGIPYRERGCSVITLAVDATTDQIGELTGKLGRIEGVSVKSGLSRG